MAGANQNLNGSHDLKGWFVIQWLGLAVINLPVKFEVFISTHEETKRDRNVENWVVWGS